MKHILLLFILFTFNNCSMYYGVPFDETVKYIDVNKTGELLLNKKKQVNAINKALEFNKYTKYTSDRIQLENNLTHASESNDDSWDSSKLKKINNLKKDVINGIKKLDRYNKVPVDCEDTAILLYLSLVKLNYPRDQIYFYYYLCPPSIVVNGNDINSDKMIGHALMIVLVNGMIPLALEQLNNYETVKYIEEKLNYYAVAFCRMDHDFLNDWKYVDKKGYENFINGFYTLKEAKNTPYYLKRKKWYNSIWLRKNFE